MQAALSIALDAGIPYHLSIMQIFQLSLKIYE